MRNRTARKRRRRKGLLTAREEGFAIVLVLIALFMLSVLGAASLLLMVSSLEGVVNMKPEDKAFQVADSAVYIAHAKIVNNEVTGTTIQSGSLLGGEYTITIQPVPGSSVEYVVTSEGSYERDGITYRRKIQENVLFHGPQAFDSMRNYLFFAGRDLNIDASELINIGAPITMNGNMRAQRNVSIRCRPGASLGTGLTINGDVEGKEQVSVEAAPFIGGVRVNLYGDIKTGDATDPTSQGIVNLTTRGWLIGAGIIYAATTGSVDYDIYRTSLVERMDGPWDRIYKGNEINGRGVEDLYIPEPNFEYYKALAEDQGNYHEGNYTLSGNLGNYGTSSVTVIYCTGDMTLNGLAWDQPEMKGVFVCEGDFTANSNLQFQSDSKFQVIAGGDVTFNNDWSFLGAGSTNEYFFWAGNDAFIDLGMFAEQRLHVSAMRDINVFSSENLFANCTVNYNPPDVDVVGFPIDLTVTDWKELSSE